MKVINPLLGSSALFLLLTACQSIHPFDGQSGYQRESSDASGVIVSYVLDARSSDAAIQHKLTKACAKELGTSDDRVSFKTLDEKEFVNLNSANNAQEHQSIAIGNTHASFGFSNTPKLSNTDNAANSYMLDSKPSMLKQITVQCTKS